MAFNVRFFGYRGMRQLPHLAQSQYTGDTVYAIEEPYEWSQVINLNGVTMTPVFSPVANDRAQIMRIELPDLAAIRYEINPPGRNVAAGNASPRLVGTDVFPWGVGYSVSVADAAGFM